MRALQQLNAMILRELRSYFLSPMFYIISIAFLLMNGLIFSVIISALQQPDAPHGAVMKSFLGGNEFVLYYIMFVVPIITMRTFSEEISTGTIELLTTVSISEKTIVLAKYISASLIYIILWIPTLLYPIILSNYTHIDIGPIVTGYIGLLTLGCMFTAIGVFFSVWTRNQVIAAITTIMVLFGIFGAGMGEYTMASGTMREVAIYINIWSQLENFSQGILDVNALIYYASVAMLFLWAALQRAEAKRWK